MRIRDARSAIACGVSVVVVGAIAVAAATRPGPDAQPSACHVTRPNASTAPGERPSAAFYGSRGLWTALPLDGVLRITPAAASRPGATFGAIHRDGSLSIKFPWWGARSASAKLTIDGRRLDGAAPRFHATLGPGSVANAPHFWPSRLRFPSPGCWQVGATSGHARLTFTTSVHSAQRSQ